VKDSRIGKRKVSKFYQWNGAQWILEGKYKPDGLKILEGHIIAMGGLY
jgi:hypothetical protein